MLVWYLGYTDYILKSHAAIVFKITVFKTWSKLNPLQLFKCMMEIFAIYLKMCGQLQHLHIL